jgi:hypothetical protein
MRLITIAKRKRAQSCILKPIAFLAVLAISGLPQSAAADEGGVSFWVPGFFGSLAATPQQPGWTNAFIFYHTSVSAGGDVAFARQVNRGNLNVNFSGNLNANIDADANLGMWAPSYVFKRSVPWRAGGPVAAGPVWPG